MNNEMHICPGEFYSATKKTGILTLAGKWLELESITLNNSDSERQKLYVLSHIQILAYSVYAYIHVYVCVYIYAYIYKMLHRL